MIIGDMCTCFFVIFCVIFSGNCQGSLTWETSALQTFEMVCIRLEKRRVGENGMG